MRDAANTWSSSRPKATADIETITAAIAGGFRKSSNFDTFRYFCAFEILLLFEKNRYTFHPRESFHNSNYQTARKSSRNEDKKKRVNSKSQNSSANYFNEDNK